MPRTRLDAFIAAFDALGVGSADIRRFYAEDRVDHIIVLSVPTYAEIVNLAQALDLSRPENHIDGGYAWWQSQRWPERGTSITVQAHRPLRAAGGDSR